MEPGAQCTVHSLLPAPVVFVYVFVPRPVPGEFPPVAGAGRTGPFGSRELFSLIARHQRGIGPPWVGSRPHRRRIEGAGDVIVYNSARALSGFGHLPFW